VKLSSWYRPGIPYGLVTLFADSDEFDIRCSHELSAHERDLLSKAQTVAAITGASQGIGATLVQAFRSRNYQVIATSRSIKPNADPHIVTTVQGDVADPETANRVFKQASDRFDC
jgi:hypothetical protein